MPSVSIVDPLTLLDRWPEVGPLVKRVLDRGASYRLADVFDLIHRGSWQLWVDDQHKAMVITSIESYPIARILLVRYAAGDLEVIARHSGLLKSWARMQKCTKVQCHGRKGWEKVLGWKLKHVVLEEDLTDVVEA